LTTKQNNQKLTSSTILGGNFVNLSKLYLMSLVLSVVYACPAMATKLTLEVPKKIEITEEQRLKAIKTMKVYDEVDISAQDFGNSGKKYKNFETVKCKFDEPKESPTGATPKFNCSNETDKGLKVKYEPSSDEVYGEVMSSRLLTGIGYKADENYMVRVECEDCPREPWFYIKSKTQPIQTGLDKATYGEFGFEKDNRVYVPATIEKKYAKTEVVTFKKEGFSFGEMFDYEGVTKQEQIYRDGLGIMAAFLQNADTKSANQRLYCPEANITQDKDGKPSCTQAVGMMQDLGYSFGRGRYLLLQPSKTDLEGWKKGPIWDNPDTCTVKVNTDFGSTIGTQKVSPESKNFIAGLLNQMSDMQIHDLFSNAKPYLNYPMGSDYKAITQEWVDTFKSKRAEITNASCSK
jgi:hypothetical protein